MKTRALVFLALLCFFPLLAHSANAWNERDLAWLAPTSCSDGTTDLTRCPVINYKIEAAGSCTASTWNPLVTVGNVLTYHASNLAAGNYCFRVKASNSAGDSLASMTTASSQTTVVAPTIPPGTPGAITVSAATAYEIRSSSTGVLTAAVIGLIEIGSPCQTDTRTVGGVVYNRVARHDVDLFNRPAKIPPTEVFARCTTTG